MIIKAPNKINIYPNEKIVFLAGSIDMDKVIKWQDEISLFIKNRRQCTILNPRRDDWDNTWQQSYDDIRFNQQVTWEQTGIRLADLVVFVFDANDKAPITLMELGLAVGLGKKCIVWCPEDYWKYGNVEMLCHLNGIGLHNLFFDTFKNWVVDLI